MYKRQGPDHPGVPGDFGPNHPAAGLYYCPDRAPGRRDVCIEQAGDGLRNYRDQRRGDAAGAAAAAVSAGDGPRQLPSRLHFTVSRARVAAPAAALEHATRGRRAGERDPARAVHQVGPAHPAHSGAPSRRRAGRRVHRRQA